MGNQIERQQVANNIEQRRPKIFSQQGRDKQQKRGISCQGGTQKVRGHLRMDNESRGSRRSEVSGGRHKKFLSLVKENRIEEPLKQSRCSDHQRKQPIFNLHQENANKHIQSPIINYQDMSNRVRQNRPTQSPFIKPRDLPRHSSQKIISTQASTPLGSIRSIPPVKVLRCQPNNQKQNNHTMSYGTQPQIQIHYVVPSVDHHQRNQSRARTSYQESRVEPFRTSTADNWYTSPIPEENISRKLKKVPLTRSYQLNSPPTSPICHPHQNQQESIFIKQLSQLSQLKHKIQDQTKYKQSRIDTSSWQIENRIDSKPKQCKQNEKLFTDPSLMNYISDSYQDLRFKETESKYALAYEENGRYIHSIIDSKDLSHSYVKDSDVSNKYSVAFDRWPTSMNEHLDDKVEREVESKEVIQEPFRFPTATDISYEERSNPSFIPMPKRCHNDRADYIQLEQQDFMQYCKPTIDSKVMADLLRLPLKS